MFYQPTLNPAYDNQTDAFGAMVFWIAYYSEEPQQSRISQCLSLHYAIEAYCVKYVDPFIVALKESK